MPEWFHPETLLANELVQDLIMALGIALLVYILVRLSKRLTLRYIDDPERKFRASKLISRTGGLITLLLIIAIFTPDPGSLLTILTVVGAGLAIAMREALLSFIGWLHITFRVPYRPGDRIEVNGIRGDVIDMRLLQTTLMEIGGWVDADQSTGRIVHFPNNWVFLHGVYNYTRGFHFIWNEVPITVTFRSNWKAAREIMLSLAEESANIVEMQARNEIRKMSREYLIYYNILSPFVYVRIDNNGVRLTLRYLCEVRKRRGTAHALTMGLLEALSEHPDIELAYPMLGITSLDTPQFGPVPDATSRRDSQTPPP